MKPVYDRMHAYFLKRDIIFADETPCQVLKEPGKTAESKSYMWLYLAEEEEGSPSIALFQYTPTRAGYHAEKFLEGSDCKFLHCDGYQGYNRLTGLTRCGCLAHVRRKWHDALPAEKNAGTLTSAEIGFDYCNRLFLIERELKKLQPEKRKAQRLEKEAPVFKAFRSWLETVDAANGSMLYKAASYTQNQWPYLENFMQDGRCEISNNLTENLARKYAVGRKNFLFHDTVAGAESSAIVYSLTETAKLNHLNVFLYLQNVLLYMPGYTDEPDNIEEMMPWSDKMQEMCSLNNKDE